MPYKPSAPAWLTESVRSVRGQVPRGVRADRNATADTGEEFLAAGHKSCARDTERLKMPGQHLRVMAIGADEDPAPTLDCGRQRLERARDQAIQNVIGGNCQGSQNDSIAISHGLAADVDSDRATVEGRTELVNGDGERSGRACRHGPLVPNGREGRNY